MRKIIGVCEFTGCLNRMKARGLCQSHYGQFHAGKPLTAIRHRREEARATRSRRDVFLWTTYRLTEVQFFALAIDGCVLCGSHKDLVVDHDHACCPGRKSCGECVRGVLCRVHNVWLGMVKDDPEFLETALAYLRRVR